MTVGELIVHLEKIGQQYGPEVHVFTRGYEGGYDDVLSVDKVDEFLLNVNDEWYYGPHERRKGIPEDIQVNYELVQGIVL